MKPPVLVMALQRPALSASNFARGEEALKKYLKYQPKDNEPELANVHYDLGQIYENQGRKAEARQATKRPCA
jgi:Flp pilus assembly protein TadD